MDPIILFILPGLQSSHLRFEGVCFVISKGSSVKKKIYDSLFVEGQMVHSLKLTIVGLTDFLYALNTLMWSSKIVAFYQSFCFMDLSIVELTVCEAVPVRCSHVQRPILLHT